MSTIQFDEENNQHYTSRRILGERVQPKMVSTLLKLGVIKSEKQAGYVLLGIAIVAFALSAYLIFTVVLPPTPSSSQDDALMEMSL